MRILVTGATGLTGGEVVRLLGDAGHEVSGASRHGRPATAGAPGHLAVDCTDETAFGPLLEKCDVLVHVAGILHVPTLARMPALRAPGMVVVVSTASIRSRYRVAAAAYQAAERMLRDVRPDAIVIRPTMIYGSHLDRNVHHVLDFVDRFGFLPLFGGGRGRLQPIHYHDLAQAISALVLASPGVTVDAGGSESLTIKEAGDAIFAALGRHPRYLPVPLALALGPTKVLDRIRGGRIHERLLRTLEDRVADNEELIRLTGIRPRDFTMGVRQQAVERDRRPG